MILVTLVFGVLLQRCGAVILTLNESAYAQLPALFALDEFDGCVAARGGVYCLVDAVLHGDNPLMNTLQEYSQFTQQHFNHTVVHRGVCASRCAGATNDSALQSTLTHCLNHSLWTSHQLQATVSNVLYCQRHGDQLTLDGVDLLVAVVYLLILALNVVGTSYDLIFCNEDDKSENPYLLSFSIRRNWRHLVGRGSAARDPRFDALKLFNGLRTMTMFCVFFSHTTLIMSYSYVNNPLFIESSYSNPLMQLLLNGSLVTHTFFVMSAFLLAYNFCVLLETRPASYKLIPRGVALRWLRLTPTYAVVLGGSATWLRAGAGPLWPAVAGSEAAACRRWWWAHLLYINNYVYDDSLCAPQTWYLAADTQLFIVGLVLCVCARGARARMCALAVLFVVAVGAVAGQTYWQDLDAVVIQSPERSYRELYAHDDTFRLLYVRGHTNLASYVLGLAAGFLAYSGQKQGFNLKSYQRWRFAYWLIVPLAVLVILSGGIWYDDGGDVRVGTPMTRALYAALYKPVFQLLVVAFILGAVFKMETVYRGVVSWRGWAWCARVAFCAFLLHTSVQRALLASQRHPTHMNNYYILVVLCATIFLSFVCGAILWLLVEAPSAAFIKTATTPRTKENSQL